MRMPHQPHNLPFYLIELIKWLLFSNRHLHKKICLYIVFVVLILLSFHGFIPKLAVFWGSSSDEAVYPSLDPMRERFLPGVFWQRQSFFSDM